MRNLSITLLAAALLSACTTYTDTLDAKLAGKSPEQKRTILAQECRQEIESGLKPDNESNVRHFERMRKICEEMTGHPVPINVPASKNNGLTLHYSPGCTV